MKHLIFALLIFTFVQPVFADDDDITYNRISFNEYATKEVENDVLVAKLYAQEEGSDAGELAHKVNKDIEWAMQRIRKHKDIHVQTLNYRTNPNYHKGRVKSWQVSQSIRLESKDSELLGRVISDLQKRLKTESINYEISDETRRLHNDMLTEEALGRFLDRARGITKSMGRKSYRIVKMNLGSLQPQQRQPVYRARAMMMEASAAAPVQLNPGLSDVTVHIDGEIEVSEK